MGIQSLGRMAGIGRALAFTRTFSASPTSGIIAVAAGPIEIIDAWAMWTTASTGSDARLQLRKRTYASTEGLGDTASATLIELLTNDSSNGIDVYSAINVPTRGTLIGNQVNRRLAVGDVLGYFLDGTLTNLAGGLVTVYFKTLG